MFEYLLTNFFFASYNTTGMRDEAITLVRWRLKVVFGTGQMTTKLLLEFPTESYPKNVQLLFTVKLKVKHKVNKDDLALLS